MIEYNAGRIARSKVLEEVSEKCLPFSFLLGLMLYKNKKRLNEIIKLYKILE